MAYTWPWGHLNTPLKSNDNANLRPNNFRCTVLMFADCISFTELYMLCKWLDYDSFWFAYSVGSSHLKWKEWYNLKPTVVTYINYVRLHVKNGLTRYKNSTLLTGWRRVIHIMQIAILRVIYSNKLTNNARCSNHFNLS